MTKQNKASHGVTINNIKRQTTLSAMVVTRFVEKLQCHSLTNRGKKYKLNQNFVIEFSILV